VLYLGAKLYYRGKLWVDLSTVDLDYGRRFYVDKVDGETGHKKGVAGAARKTLGFIFN
jgi:yeast amino acid transporter